MKYSLYYGNTANIADRTLLIKSDNLEELIHTSKKVPTLWTRIYNNVTNRVEVGSSRSSIKQQTIVNNKPTEPGVYATISEAMELVTVINDPIIGLCYLINGESTPVKSSEIMVACQLN